MYTLCTFCLKIYTLFTVKYILFTYYEKENFSGGSAYVLPKVETILVQNFTIQSELLVAITERNTLLIKEKKINSSKTTAKQVRTIY